ncbi:uncharacterized protein RCH25_025618 [Pelodytes ibericus]
MTLLTELYLLHGKDTYIDRVVGWGVFPLCDNNLNLLEGKFRCPFLRGHYDSRIDRFSKIEDLIMTDIDHWLCNLYFQVIKLPQFLNDPKEYDVFVQLPQEFLSYTTHNEKSSEFEEDIKKSVLQRDESKQSYHHQVTSSSLYLSYVQGGATSMEYERLKRPTLKDLLESRGPRRELTAELVEIDQNNLMANANAPKGEEDEIQRIMQGRLTLYGPNPPTEVVTQLLSAAMEEARDKGAYHLQVLTAPRSESPTVVPMGPLSETKKVPFAAFKAYQETAGEIDGYLADFERSKNMKADALSLQIEDPASVVFMVPITSTEHIIGIIISSLITQIMKSYSQRQPLAPPRDLNIHKELIPSKGENMETQLNRMTGEMDISKETKTKIHQKSLMEYVEVKGTANEGTKRNFRQKICKKGIRSNKIVPYADKQTLPMKDDFNINQKKSENDPPDRFQWTQKKETTIQKQMEQCSTSTSYLDELEKHRFSVCSEPLNGMHMYQRIVKRTTFIIWAVFSEMEIGQWRSHDFWSIILMISLMWFLRLYLHYCSQWLFLQAISIPVIKFTFYPHTVELSYQNSLMHTIEELSVVVIGPMSLNIFMVLMIFLRWSCQTLLDSFPTILSKSIIALGLWTVLDPLVIFLVDAFLGRLSYSAENPIADAAKLYWVFYRTEQSGLPGILITLLVYTMIFIISFSVLYLYFLRVHKESWILDVFQRISCNEEVFPVPYDLEISNQELSQIVRKSEQWRGINGERRKVTVYDYIWKKEASGKSPNINLQIQQQYHLDSTSLEDEPKDITTHVLIYTIHLSGFRELYRQFLRLSDGAIVEIFGDFSGINLLPKEVSKAAEEHLSQTHSPEENTTTMDLRERKKSTTSC